jgi:hypothetical protein
MSSTFESYTIKQLDEAESNLLKQVERIRKERKSRNSENKKEFSLSSLFSMKSSSEKKEPSKKKESSEEKPKKKSEEKSTPKKSNDDDSRPIKATVVSMKEVLNYHHVDFPSNAKKDELSTIVRKHNLVRECEKKDANKKA